MQTQGARGLREIIGMLTVVMSLLWLPRASTEAIAEFVVPLDRSSVEQDLRDLLAIMREEASVAAEPDRLEVPSWVETSRSSNQWLDTLGPEQCEPWQVISDRRSTVPSYGRGSVGRLGVAIDGSSETR